MAKTAVVEELAQEKPSGVDEDDFDISDISHYRR